MKQSGPHCLVHSAAMCLDIEPENIHKEIGHDGTEIWWEPNKMRGIHIQEIQDVANNKGMCFFPIEMYPAVAPDMNTEPREIYQHDLAHARFLKSLYGKTGILIMDTHACAWDGDMVYDPKGFTATLGDYDIREVWLLGKMI